MSDHPMRFKEPPAEAYSRVTNAERFRPLHQFALERFRQLEVTFDVDRTELDVPDPDIKVALARSRIRLAPKDAAGAPLVVALTTFPGLYLRCGRWRLDAFPSCGCDACDETLDDQTERFHGVIDDVIAGRFSEAVRIPLLGDAWLEWSFGPSRGGRARIDRKRARQLVASAASSVAWKPWPTR